MATTKTTTQIYPFEPDLKKRFAPLPCASIALSTNKVDLMIRNDCDSEIATTPPAGRRRKSMGRATRFSRDARQ